MTTFEIIATIALSALPLIFVAGCFMAMDRARDPDECPHSDERNIRGW